MGGRARRPEDRRAGVGAGGVIGVTPEPARVTPMIRKVRGTRYGQPKMASMAACALAMEPASVAGFDV